MRRKTNKSKTRSWRRLIRRIFFLTILVLFLTTASVPPEKVFDLHFSPFVSGRRFDWIGWEASAVLEEIVWWLHSGPILNAQDSSGTSLEEKSQVLAFLDQQRQIAELESQIREEIARLPQPAPASPLEQSPVLPASVAPLERRLDELRRQQQAAAPRVERIMAAQVGQILAGEGLSHNHQVWPPITFRFNDMPTYLVVSRRDEISVYRGIHMLPDVSEAERTSLETAIEARLDVSALVVDVGGIGSWPTMVMDNASLPSLFDIVAHEWTHNYLFFRPLGLRYGDSRDLTTMNETSASIVGAEVADLVIARYYPELVSPPVTRPKPPAEVDGSPHEDFNQAMRRIRLHVDDLLTEGRMSEAEAYMEAERQKLVAAGYNLRRLNQAYFAFHGSYAASPASVDPIGPWMRQLRTQSGSLKAFLEQVAQMRSLDDLLRVLDK
jgi:hypothetical protein